MTDITQLDFKQSIMELQIAGSDIWEDIGSRRLAEFLGVWRFRNALLGGNSKYWTLQAAADGKLAVSWGSEPTNNRQYLVEPTEACRRALAKLGGGYQLIETFTELQPEWVTPTVEELLGAEQLEAMVEKFPRPASLPPSVTVKNGVKSLESWLSGEN